MGHIDSRPRGAAASLSALSLVLTLAAPGVYAGQAASSAPPVGELALFQEIPSVYAASKHDQTVSEAPASVSIVTSEEIARYGYRSLADILRSVRGFYVTYDRSYHYLGVRGFSRPSDYNTRVLLLVDGVRLNDSVYDSASIGTEFILDVDLIERVEVVRGPSSSLYGSNALFGVINVVTRGGRAIKGLEVSGAAGTFRTRSLRVSYGGRSRNGIETVLSGSYYESEGDDRLYFPEFDDPDTNDGVFEDGDHDKNLSFFGKVSFKDITFEGAYVEREKGLPTGAYETVFNDSRSMTIDKEYFADLKYEHLFPSQWDILARVHYAAYPYNGDYIYDYADEGGPPHLVTNSDSSDARWWCAEVQGTRTFLEKHRLTVGTEYRYNQKRDQKNFDEEIFLDDHRSSQHAAAFIQDEWRAADALIINAGLRYDSFEDFGGITNPRIAVIYRPVERTVLKFLYGEAFRVPNTYERFFEDGGETQKPNPDLDPESIRTFEGVLEQSIGGNLRAVATGFVYYMDDLITLETDPADDLLVFRNVEDVKSVGLEFELEGRWENGLEGRLSYTYQEAENRETGEWLTNSPRHLGTANVVVPLIRDRLDAGFELHYSSARRDLSGEETAPYFLANVTLFSTPLAKSFKVSASVYNLFDEDYSDPASEEHVQEVIPQDGRTLRLKLTYTF